MPSYQVRYQTVTVAGNEYKIRSLLDLQQFSDPAGDAQRMGISSAGWPLFGQIWPSALVLARAMHDFDLDGKRILEIGAGLALSSLVIHRRAGDITVSDWHPLSSAFLNENLVLNRMTPLPYQTGNWAGDNPELGWFDLIIGSDVLYEPQHPGLLARFIDKHAAEDAQVIIVDPDRGNRVAFCREMSALGYQNSWRRADRRLENGDPYKGRFLIFNRPSAAVAA
ncbi:MULTISPECIES: class I SAM-dependent methyltransferase [Methylomonas]|uniref:class I SAM-dependent methyltransferase n=1 Tax=Methylomonas TaxID=416 RepID=UPI00123284FC|nr:SAM-dependent methyltransferase [Methylomonas rhizoryzae]